MKQNCSLHSARDTNMDGIYDNSMEKMEIDDSCITPADKTNQHLPDREGPSSSCSKTRRSFRPKLQATKSFPPYSQCIGGLGEDGEANNDPTSELVSTCSSAVPEDKHDKSAETETKTDQRVKCSREAVRAKWRSRRKEMSWRSCDVDTDVPERGLWCGKRMEGVGKERKDEENEGDVGKHRRDKSSKDRDEEEEKKTGRSSTSTVNMELMDTRNSKDEDPDGTTESSTKRHLILSRLLHSSSTSSSCSSINFSSAESDEVFSEGEDAASKSQNFRKNRSWRTYLTMMHWSLRRQSSWVQLAGHQGNFQLTKGGEVLKLYSEGEAKCLDSLMRDPLRPFVPQYHGLVTRGDHCYIRLEDLLSGLTRPLIMDCKMGVRTYQEEELVKASTKPNLRSDMYQKMVKVDPLAPSEEEHKRRGVTKWRYLQWRDTTTSTSTLGFRIEGLMMEDGSVQRDFRRIRTLAQVTEALLYFTRSHLQTLEAYHSRLLALGDALKNSTFFRKHEVIGSSLLFVHDHSKASVWMIDFGKTTPLPDSMELQHNIPWVEGSREDGYLIGLTSLIASLSQAINKASGLQEDGCGQAKSVA
ncbi:inositol-trisphosphate 3-kinase A [Oryzias melastigma]|uniref:inositol-trisphosphate 3-kinase A n=1 Tax=Oryzias melastigma TaxID=30732 RepID=UPI000CF7DC3E|nr:inositol-trisphosphate 3-kinase A [Oryzias melastigma]